MTVFEELRQEAYRTLQELGDTVTITSVDGLYDAATLINLPVDVASQQLLGTVEVPKPDQFRQDGLTRQYERVATVSPVVVSGTAFTPQTGDLLAHDGKTYVIKEVAVERKGGVDIVFNLGLEQA